MRDFWRASFVCLFIALAVSVVIACSHRYSLVAPPPSDSEGPGVFYVGVVYRIDHWTGRVALIRPDRTEEGIVGVKIYDRMRSVP
jgi:hypothetical protein